MQALIKYIEQKNLTQVDLAKTLGVHQGQLNNWLQKKRIPNARNLKLIWQKTGITLEKLVEDL